MDNYLDIQRVGKSFPTGKGVYTALTDVSLTIGHGEFVTLIGHSGCGKSTLLSLIAGLERPTGGRILLGDREVRGPGPDRGVVFQNYSLLPWLTLRENVREAVHAVLGSQGPEQVEQRVEQYLRVVGLWEHREKRPAQVSGGMKQRAAIARAFAINPEVLLLDEPFGALDALTRSTLQEELLRLWSMEGQTKTVIMVTHDIEEAIYLSDKIVVLSNGPAATIHEVLEVPLPRPRDKRALARLPEYAALKDRLLYLLTVELARESA